MIKLIGAAFAAMLATSAHADNCGNCNGNSGNGIGNIGSPPTSAYSSYSSRTIVSSGSYFSGSIFVGNVGMGRITFNFANMRPRLEGAFVGGGSVSLEAFKFNNVDTFFNWSQ